jgi:hypothetical protein
MPLYFSYLLQPLNITYFALLKRLYSDAILALVYSYIYYINKKIFLLAFKAAFKKIFIAENIYIGFQSAGLALYNLEAILLKLNICLYTLLSTTIKDSA